MKIGYARVSTFEQNLDLQIDALKAEGCKDIVTDEIGGSIAERPGLKRLKDKLREGDTVVVWRLDRMGRSLKHLIEFIGELKKIGVGFKSLNESIDTSTSTGELIFHIFGALSQFERNLIIERTRAGMEAARARGRQGGRPKKLDKNKIAQIIDLYKSKKYSLKQICTSHNISKQTLYNYIEASNSTL